MYSSEIDKIIEQSNHNINSRLYQDICATSPQISRVKYEPYGDFFDMWTKDGFHWNFRVHPKV